MSAKHSPGPWRVGRDGVYFGDTKSDARKWRLPITWSGTTDCEAAANARLLASAPELLEALENLADRVGVLAAHSRAPALNELELVRAVEAIAKARGGQ